MTGDSLRGVQRTTLSPEFNVVVFSFLLNYPWEFLQTPFFEGALSARSGRVLVVCSVATVGDALLSLFAFWCVALAARSRRWILRPRRGQLLGFISVGLFITVVVERLATGPLDLWRYAAAMPLVPILEVGLTPILQWTLLPLLVVWFARRQLQ